MSVDHMVSILHPDVLRPFLVCCAGRLNDFALQRADGRYYRVGRPLTYDDLLLHFQGVQTIATYVISERGLCRSAIYDSDADNGLILLIELQLQLELAGIPAYLEQSRRGAHLRIFFDRAVSPTLARQWLLPWCPAGIEFYPKQDDLGASSYGSLMRLPLGVHKRSGVAYPFVMVNNGEIVPVASTIEDTLQWFATVGRAVVPDTLPTKSLHIDPQPIKKIPFKKTDLTTASPPTMIQEWCLRHDPFAVIGNYVDLDARGCGCCPFGFHHRNGVDSHPSFFVYTPVLPDIRCWYCHTWKQGGSLFDFFKYYYSVDARTLWLQIQRGGQF